MKRFNCRALLLLIAAPTYIFCRVENNKSNITEGQRLRQEMIPMFLKIYEDNYNQLINNIPSNRFHELHVHVDKYLLDRRAEKFLCPTGIWGTLFGDHEGSLATIEEFKKFTDNKVTLKTLNKMSENVTRRKKFSIKNMWQAIKRIY
jgi:hypothetical protein